ncbi:MAG: hypothetical protein ABSE89_12485 [Sedimentisphaerales bacterium]
MKRTSLLWAAVVLSAFCFASRIFAADGFGGNATGGAGGSIVTVSTAADLKRYVEPNNSPYIVQVTGTIDLGSIGGGVKIQSNKTIKGISPGTTITGRLGFRDDANNIIIERLNITNPVYDEKDGISVKDRITNLFITHCTVYDCCDGQIDITEASDYVTVSWCKFYYNNAHDHRFVNLIGASDSATGDAGKLHVTMHHNWWSTLCKERMPRVRFGKVHVYNNYYDCSGNSYCVGVGNDCNILLEGNYFNSVANLWADYGSSGHKGLIHWRNVGNVLYNCSTPTWAPDSVVFTPPYSYTLDSGWDIPAIVMNGAGADGNDSEPPSAPTGLTATAGFATVGLNWNDNNESDLAGYNVYRSTTSGSGYSKLNSSLLSDSNYTDSNVSHDTTFYYVVTAVDTSTNDSNFSNEVFGGLFGDFTGNGIVEMNDLPAFLDFWLVNDCNETAGVDLDENCIVNFYEFAVLAENWLK